MERGEPLERERRTENRFNIGPARLLSPCSAFLFQLFDALNKRKRLLKLYCENSSHKRTHKLATYLTVSSVHIAESCVENITAVKMAKSKLSKTRNIIRMTVAGGEYVLQPVGSKTGLAKFNEILTI